MDSFQAGAFGYLFAAKGMRARSGGKILQVEVRIKCQQTVGNLWVQFGQIARYSCYFLLIHIAGNQQGAGNEHWRLWSVRDQLAQDSEVLQGLSVGDSAQSIVNTFVPGLEIELNASSRLQRQAADHAEKGLLRTAVGLPTHAEDPPGCILQGELGGL